MRKVAAAVAEKLGLAFSERDVRDDPVLERRFLFEIPVLLLGEREVARHRTTEDELEDRLAGLLGREDERGPEDGGPSRGEEPTSRRR